MKTYRVATIPGDGIGKEVIPVRFVLSSLQWPKERECIPTNRKYCRERWIS
jgi:isocitrate/isopropylmalate dehydrogenase